MSLYTKYIDTDKPNIKIKMAISFNKEPWNWATGERRKRGYQVTCIPVEKGEGFESFTAFSGFNDCLLEIERQSSKRLTTAISTLDTKTKEYLDYFRNRGYIIP